MEIITIDENLIKYLSEKDVELVKEATSLLYSEKTIALNTTAASKLIHYYFNILNVVFGYKRVISFSSPEEIDIYKNKKAEYIKSSKLYRKASIKLLRAIKSYIIDLYKKDHPEIVYVSYNTARMIYFELKTDDVPTLKSIIDRVNKLGIYDLANAMQEAKEIFSTNG